MIAAAKCDWNGRSFDRSELPLAADLDCTMRSTSSVQDRGVESICSMRIGGRCGGGGGGGGGAAAGLIHGAPDYDLGASHIATMGANFSPISADKWSSSPLRDRDMRQENLNAAGVRKRCTFSDGGEPFVVAREVSAGAEHNECASFPNKARRQSPALAAPCFAFSQSSRKVPFFGSAALSANPASEAWGHPAANFGAAGEEFALGGGAFASSSLINPFPLDSLVPDFSMYDLQESIVSDEGLRSVVTTDGCRLIDRVGGSLRVSGQQDESFGRDKSESRSGVPHESKESAKGCTWPSRKPRMDRSRKAADRGGAVEGVVDGAHRTEDAAPWSPAGSAETLTASPGMPTASECGPKDRDDAQQLQLLLQKVLRPSDVGNLSRMVLPKKDAETHLPWLGAGEKIQLTCEDYDTGEKVTLRYRFWPNNRSRMYVLENTGDFVKKHKLQESDRVMIYRNLQGSYLIRALKTPGGAEGVARNVQSKDMDGLGNGNSQGGIYKHGKLSPEQLNARHSDGAPNFLATVFAISKLGSQSNLLDFGDMPDEAMGTVAGNLVQFPRLESFDTPDMLALGSAAAEKQTVG